MKRSIVKRPNCQCVSPDGACGSIKHDRLFCTQPAELKLQSRDWDGEIYDLCVLCAVEAAKSGIFVGVGR